MYAKQIGITAETGFFFTLMAVGMAISRLFSGRLVDKGMITQVISAGLYLVCICYFGLRMAYQLEQFIYYYFILPYLPIAWNRVWNNVSRL